MFAKKANGEKDIQNILFVFNLVKRRVPWLYPVGEESSYQICERAPAASFPKGAPASLMDYPTSYSPTRHKNSVWISSYQWQSWVSALAIDMFCCSIRSYWIPLDSVGFRFLLDIFMSASLRPSFLLHSDHMTHAKVILDTWSLVIESLPIFLKNQEEIKKKTSERNHKKHFSEVCHFPLIVSQSLALWGWVKYCPENQQVKKFMKDLLNNIGWFRSTSLMQNSCWQPHLWPEVIALNRKYENRRFLKCQGRMFWCEGRQNKGNAISQYFKSRGHSGVWLLGQSDFWFWSFNFFLPHHWCTVLVVC